MRCHREWQALGEVPPGIMQFRSSRKGQVRKKVEEGAPRKMRDEPTISCSLK